MKYILICVIVLAGALMGNTFTAMEKKRLLLIGSLITAAGSIETAMVRRGYMIAPAFEERGEECLGIFRRCAHELRRHPELSGREAARRAIKEAETDKDIGSAVAEYVETLSTASVSSQIEKGTEVFTLRLRELYKETKETRLKRAGTARNLCLFSAIALGIILI